MKTTQEVRDQWTAALRSGQYEQGQGQLRTADNKFCCLGVLCDILDPEGWENQGRLRQPEWVHRRGSSGYPVKEVLDAAGITRDQAGRLGAKNDIHGAGFGDVADYIETDLDSLAV